MKLSRRGSTTRLAAWRRGTASISCDLPVGELRQRLGAVFQDFMTYEMSVAENIAVGDVDDTDNTEELDSVGRTGSRPPRAGRVSTKP